MNKRRNDYSKLKRKISFRIFLTIFAVTAIFILLCFVIHKNFSVGESIVRFLMKMHLLESVMINQSSILNRFDVITLIVILIFLGILLKFSISWFTKYFEEVSAGMDRLAEKSDEEITLSPELDFMENKLNQIKNNLEKQKKAALAAEQRKNDLVVYLAHDIKTPLTSVIGY